MLGLAQFRRNRAVHDDARVLFAPEPAPHAQDRIFVFVPHCDDETLGVGGLIHQARRSGAAVEIAFTTNGDGSRSTQIAENAKRMRHNSFLDLAAMRQREALAACAELGVAAEQVHFLGFPDRGTGQMWLHHWQQPYRSPFTRVAAAPYPNSTTPHAPYSGTQLLADTCALMARFGPTRVFTTHPNDTHPDHWACWAFALAALESLRADEGNAWAQQCELRAFMVHRGVWPAPHGYNPHARLAPPADLLHGGAARTWTSWELDDAARAAKKAALAQHDSQMAFTPHYLRGFLRRNELFEIIESANGHTAFEAESGAARGISLVALNDECATLRMHLRLAAAPRGNCTLYLRAFSAQGARAWNVDLHGRESHAHIKDEAFVARAHEDAKTPHNWRARRREIESREIGGPKAGSGKRTARGGTTFDLDVPLQALGGSEGVSLLVSGVSRLGKAVLEQTEIGVLRLSNFGNKPLLVARSDPRYSVRDTLRAARQEAKLNRKRS